MNPLHHVPFDHLPWRPTANRSAGNPPRLLPHLPIGLGTALGLVAILCGCIGHPLLAAETSLPNLLVVLADDCTFRDLGCYGGQAHTPHIDRLAKQGVRMTRCFQAAPMCSPTRHNLYTGLYPVKSGAYPNHTFVKPGVRSVPDYLKPLGYRVALSGKTHIAPRTQFEFEYSGKGNNPDEQVIDKLFGQCAETETPFCLFACSNEPHSPWNKGDASAYDVSQLTLPPYFVDTPETRSNLVDYLAEITYFDGQVGRLVELLEKHDLTDNTLVIVLSEQGWSFPFGKWTCYDTGLQSALVARWPGRIPAGAVNDAMVEYIDVLPTLIAAAGGTVPSDLQGSSLLPVLQNQTDQHKEYVYGEMTTRGIINGSETFGIRSVRSERFKLIVNFTPEVTFQNACTSSDIFQSWVLAAKTDPEAAEKVRRYQHRPAIEFYDIVADPLEWNNLADDADFAEPLRVHRSQLATWMAAQGDLGQATEAAALERKKGKRKRAR